MKTIEDKAHDYALEMLKRGDPEHKIPFDAFALAEAMQAEAEKRKPKEEWQPDWSQAPSNAEAWRMYGDGNCAWLIDMNGDFRREKAPSFNYQGNWRNSLRKRP